MLKNNTHKSYVKEQKMWRITHAGSFGTFWTLGTLWARTYNYNWSVFHTTQECFQQEDWMELLTGKPGGPGGPSGPAGPEIP